MFKDTFNDRCKLDIFAVYLLEEMIKIQWIVSIEVINNRHCIPFYTMFFQKINPLHHFDEGGLPHFIFTIFIVKFLRSINRNAYQPVIFSEELAPFIGQHGSVGLDAVIDRSSAGVFLLQFHSLFVEGERAHKCFSSVPGEKHLRHGL